MLNKKGLSEIVGYVLLIMIAFSIAGMVFMWLRAYVQTGETAECDSGVSLSIREYNYSDELRTINLTVRNDGRFDVDGYVIRVNNNSITRFGEYKIFENATKIKVNTNIGINIDEIKDISNDENITGRIKMVEIQPFVHINNKKTYCEKRSKQNFE